MPMTDNVAMCVPKTCIRKRLTRPRLLCVWVAASLLVGPAYGSDPIQVQAVVEGTATFETNGVDTTIYASDGAIVEYGRFDVPAEASVEFVQPTAQSRVLNRILAAEPSLIDGTVLANGIVYFVNPSGIAFGEGAVIDVGRLYAIAGHIGDDDFRNSIDRFTTTHGELANLGTIQTESGAHLVGHSVSNAGSIVTAEGIVTLTAGSEVYLAENGSVLLIRVDNLDALTATGAEGPSNPAGAEGVSNTGDVEADEVVFSAGDVYSLAVVNSGRVRASGGRVTLSGNGLVVNEGEIDVSDAAAAGGSVRLLGEWVAAADGRIDVSGATGGGEILIGGDFQGSGPERSAARTAVGPDAELVADALEAGDGGRVIVWADEQTNFRGHISARGGPAGGDGGFVEVSGKQALAFRGSADLNAPAGERGTLLLDPTDIVIAGGTADGDGDGSNSTFSGNPSGTPGTVLFADVGPVTLYESELQAQSGSADIVLEATRSISVGAGGFSGATVDLLPGADITLRTRNSAVDGAGGIDLTTGAHAADFQIEATGGGNILIEAATSGEATGDIVLGRLTSHSGDITVRTGYGIITLANTITSTSGSVTLGGGQPGIPTTATIRGLGDGGNVSIHAGSRFQMGTHEKLSVNGDLDIHTTLGAGEILIGDLSARSITVDALGGAGNIRLQRRAPGSVLLSGGGFAADGGVDYVAESSLTLLGNLLLDGSGADPVFASTDTSLISTPPSGSFPTVQLASFGPILDAGVMLDLFALAQLPNGGGVVAGASQSDEEDRLATVAARSGAVADYGLTRGLARVTFIDAFRRFVAVRASEFRRNLVASWEGFREGARFSTGRAGRLQLARSFACEVAWDDPYLRSDLADISELLDLIAWFAASPALALDVRENVLALLAPGDLEPGEFLAMVEPVLQEHCSEQEI